MAQKNLDDLQWFHVLDVTELPEGRVKTVSDVMMETMIKALDYEGPSLVEIMTDPLLI